MSEITKKRLLIGLTLLNLAFIFGNSLLPAEASAAISGSVKAILSWLFPMDGIAAEGTGDSLLRKIAHFAEFACLGFLLLHGMRTFRMPKPFLSALLLAFLAACIDETLQLFSPGRAASIWDVLLDTAGSLTGITAALFLPVRKKKP